jgi:hypothetical protein
VADEARTECFAIQSVGKVALGFGASVADAATVQRYYGDHRAEISPEPPGYWTPKCTPGGAYDLGPTGWEQTGEV